jgi:hypothetical protein
MIGSHRNLKVVLFSLVLGCFAGVAYAQPVVSLSPTSLAFGNQQVGVPTSLPIKLTNTGNATLTITKIQITGANGTDFTQTNTCGTSVAAGANCTFTVVFTPSWTGARAGSLTITDNATPPTQTVNLTGTGLAPAVAFSPSSLTFADQAISSSSSSQNITLTNNGQTALAISSVAIAGSNPSDFAQTNNCGTSLAINATCTITVTFTPTEAWGRTAAIWLTDNALGSPHVAGLMGNGVSGGVASFSPSSLTFATALMGTTSAAQTVTLNNSGTAPLQVGNITTAGDYIQTNTCATSVAAGGSCTISVQFTPSINGARAGWVDVYFTDPAGVQTVALTGTGASPAPVLVKPRAASVTYTQTEQYTAYLSNVVTTNVTWYVDNVAGGNSTAGTISSSGLYTPPATAGSHIVKAVNVANTKQSASVPIVVSGYTGTLTHHNDTFRTGQNNSETALTTGNVNPTQFGKLFSYPVDGQIYGEPLWVPNVTISGVAHNVVYVTTQNDSVYAFDADNGTLYPNALWHASFINPPGITAIPRADVEKGLDISPEVGITSTPVIDPALGVMFVEARTLDTTGTANCTGSVAPQYFHYLHELNIATGAEMPGSPVMVCAQVPGTGYDNVKGTVTFNPQRQNNRAGLLLLNGVVYVAFASLEDISPYHGWVLGYNESNITAPPVIFNYTPNGNKAGIWHGGGGIPADASGNLYISTGTGSFVNGSGGGISFTKLTPSSNTLKVSDFFSPFNQTYLTVEAINLDLSSSGPMLLPDQPGAITHEAVMAGKTGTLYLINRDNMGQYNASADNVVQALYTTIGGAVVPTGNWGTPAYFNGQVYIQGVKDSLKQFGLSTYPGGTALLSGGPLALGSPVIGYPGTTPAISSNGTKNGIVWVIESDGAASSKAATLWAYDAADIAHSIYNSGASGKRDTAGAAVKFAIPTVANGKVYVNTAVELDVYGLLP